MRGVADLDGAAAPVGMAGIVAAVAILDVPDTGRDTARLDGPVAGRAVIPAVVTRVAVIPAAAGPAVGIRAVAVMVAADTVVEVTAVAATDVTKP